MSRTLYRHVKAHLREHPCHRCIVTVGLVFALWLAEAGRTTPAIIVGLITNLVWIWGEEPERKGD